MSDRSSIDGRGAGGGPPVLPLVLLTLLAASLRLYRLDFQSLWNDELASWHAAHWGGLAEVLSRGVVPDVHPPGFFLLLHLWMRVAGESEWALRAPSALAGVLTVPAVYGLGRSLWGRREGLVAAAITATAWLPVYYSREARPYALLVLCAVVSTWWLIETMRRLEQDGVLPLPPAAAYVAAATGTAYTHYFGLLLVGLQALGAGLFFLRRSAAWPRLAALWAAVGLAYLPWVPHLIEDLRLRSFWIPEPAAADLLELYRFQLGRWDAVAWLIAVLLGASLGRWLLLDTRGASARERIRRAASSPAALLVLWLVVPPLVAWIRSRLAAPVFTLRNLVLTAPALYLLTARALTRLGPSRAGGALAAAALCSLLLFDLGVRRRLWSEPTKEQWREAVAQVVEAEPSLRDAPVFAAALHPDYFAYYFERMGSRRRVHLLVSGRDVPALERLLAQSGARRFWYLGAHRAPAPSLRRHLRRRHRLLRQEDLLGATVQLYAVGTGP